MIIACPECHKQYDVRGLAPGARVRCFCGERCTVPEPSVLEARMQHCSSCGGRLEDGATHCAYCSSPISLAERGLGEACPACLRRLAVGADFCSSCGTRIAPEQPVQLLAEQNCPRCAGPLALREFRDGAFTECTACGGIWLAEDVFEEMARERERSAIARWIPRQAAASESVEPARELEVKYLACPVCHQLMNRQNYAGCSGVIIDWCKGHGYWFDTRELERIVQFIRAGGLDTARDRKVAYQRYRLERLATNSTRTIPTLPGVSQPQWPGAGPLGGTPFHKLLIDLLSSFFQR